MLDPPHPGPEGCFGLGGAGLLIGTSGPRTHSLVGHPTLAGPFRDTPGANPPLTNVSGAVATLPPAGTHLKVFNASDQQAVKGGGAPVSKKDGGLGWAFLAALALALIGGALARKFRAG